MSQQREQRLDELLREVFDVKALRRWVRLHLPAVWPELPGESAGLADHAFTVVLALGQHGLGTRATFESLIGERPGHEARIREVGRLWYGGADPAPPEPHPAMPAPHRAMPAPHPAMPAPRPRGPIRVLFVATSSYRPDASPPDEPARPDLARRGRFEEEVRAIEHRMQTSRYRDAVASTAMWAVRPDDLIEGLNRHRPHIVHFSSYGDAHGLYFVGNDGRPLSVSGRALARLFGVLQDDVRVVVFNACHSESWAREVGEHIDFVVSMRAEISDDATRVFAATFYGGLGYGRTIRNAFDIAVAAICVHGLPDEDAPVLTSRRDVSPSATLVGPDAT